MNQISIKLDKNIDMDFLNFGVLKEREIFYINLKLSDSQYEQFVFKTILFNLENKFIKELDGSIGSSFCDGLLRLNNTDKNSFIDKNANIIKINFPYDLNYRDFHEGLIAVMVDKKMGFANISGKLTIDAKFDWVDDFSQGLAMVKFNGKFGVIDKKGNFVIQAKFKAIRNFKENLAAVCLHDKWGFVDKKGKIAIAMKYNEVKDFSQSLAGVKIDNKWGFIDKKENFVIQAKFKAIRNFKENLAAVCLHDKWGFVDKKGKIIIKAKYDFIDDKDDEMVMFGSKHGLYLLLFKENILGCFHEGLALARINKKYGFIDKNENLVIEAKYDEVEDFDKGLAIAKLDGKSGLLDKNGRVIVDFLYEKILVVNKDIIILVKNNEILIQKI
ncbi:WG repeat-containing protein [Campylobacter coli]|nr:WG repeat-containing protein [Campylobacter coli]EAW0594393.1 WG repeat-containing protein [Campylobacter coli]EIN8285076.1 WG repeat-containing protein [Campylobacter coli]